MKVAVQWRLHDACVGGGGLLQRRPGVVQQMTGGMKAEVPRKGGLRMTGVLAAAVSRAAWTAGEQGRLWQAERSGRAELESGLV